MKQATQALNNSGILTERDDSILRLLAAEQRLSAKIGEKRVAELWRFWQKKLPANDELTFKQAMDHDDKKLTWLWFRLKRAYHSRANREERYRTN